MMMMKQKKKKKKKRKSKNLFGFVLVSAVVRRTGALTAPQRHTRSDDANDARRSLGGQKKSSCQFA